MFFFHEKYNLAIELFLLNKETQVEIFSETVFNYQSMIAGVRIFDMITASMRAVFHWFW